MTNFQRWHLYCKHVESPESFIKFGYYSLIASCLQRRVWVGPVHAPIYPNLYIILCGGPGSGKGQIIKPIGQFLGHWKRHTAAELDNLNKQLEAAQKKASRGNPSIFSSQQINTINQASAELNGYSKKLVDEPLLFPIASESFGSYQALVNALAESYDAKHYTKSDGGSATYLHSSMSMVLEELASIFRKHSEDIANFLLQTYDCGDYRYTTLSRETDRIKNCCLNILAGTTPAFMQETLDDRLTNEGFASRTFFICAEEPRFKNMHYKELDSAQNIAKMELLLHLKKLKDVYGGCTYTKEAYEFLAHWWEKGGSNIKANASPKLASYYARKKVHVQKLATVIHYSDKLDNIITLAEVKQAMEELEEAEKNMHLALTFRGNNPLTTLGRALERYLEAKGRATKNALITDLWEYGQPHELNQVMEAYIVMKKIEEVSLEGTRYWRIVK